MPLPGVSTGKVDRPLFILLHGVEGVGKTVWAASAPKPIFLGPEDGTAHLDVARFDKSDTWENILANVNLLLTEDHDYKTLVLDSVDWIEPLLHKYICNEQKVESIEDSFGSFGKWVGGVSKVWIDFISTLKKLRDEKKMYIVAIAHSHIKAFNDPTQNLAYDRYVIKMTNDKHAAIWKEASDCVLFANFEVLAKKENKHDRKAKAYGEDKRVLYTQRRPSFDAKNRQNLPFELALDWNEFYTHTKSSTPESIETIKIELLELSKMMPKESSDKMFSAVEKASGDVDKLLNIRNYARVLSEQGV